MLLKERDILLEDMTFGFPVDGALAHQSPLVSNNRHYPAGSAHFPEGSSVDTATTCCMAIFSDNGTKGTEQKRRK